MLSAALLSRSFVAGVLKKTCSVVGRARKPKSAYVDANSFARAFEGGRVAQALGRDPSRSGSVTTRLRFPTGLVLRVTKNETRFSVDAHRTNPLIEPDFDSYEKTGLDNGLVLTGLATFRFVRNP